MKVVDAAGPAVGSEPAQRRSFVTEIGSLARIPATFFSTADVRHGCLVIAVGSLIACLGPFNATVAFASGGTAIGRVALIVTLGFVGLLCANRVGLQISPKGLRHRFLTPLAIGAIVALEIVVVDCFMFRSDLRSDYVTLFRNNDLRFRLLFFMLGAYAENIYYRLFLMSALVWAISLIWRGGNRQPANWVFWAALTITQFVNAGFNVVAQIPDPITPVTLAYDALRYICPGLVWGYLYWRHGLVSAEIGAVGAHPFLQPLLGYLLQ